MATLNANAVTLAEHALASNDPIVTKVTDSLYRTTNVLKYLPISTRKTPHMKGVRWTNTSLPQVGWRRINETPDITKGRPSPYEEQVFIMSNRIQVDEILMMDENAIQDPIQMQIDGWMAAATYNFNNYFINNDPTSGDLTNNDPDAIAGLRYRLDNIGQYGIPSEMKINGIEGTGTAINATLTASADDANNLLSTFQAALDFIGAPSGEDVVVFMSDIMKRRLARAVRKLGAGGGFEMTRDAFDRKVETYAGAIIQDIGRKSDGTTRIIGNETASGVPASNGAFTSMYFVRFAEGYFSGWQMKPMKPTAPVFDPINQTSYNSVIDYPVGLWIPNNRAFARVNNIQLT